MKWLAALVSCMLLSAPVLASEITPAERRDHAFDAALPGCGDSLVLSDITWRFEKRESKFWNSDLRIVGFENIRETAWRPWGLEQIPRRFCTGTALVSDGYKRKVEYSVRDGLGVLGTGWGTDWCVTGLDRNYAYAPQCKQAAP